MQNNYSDHCQQPSFAIKYSQKITNLQQRRHQEHLKLSFKIGNSSQGGKNTFKIYSERKVRYRSIDTSERNTNRYGQHQLANKDDVMGNKSMSSRQKKKESSLGDQKKEYEKIPIQFSDETPWAGLKGRLVYRGHAPRNSYYLMAKLKECEEEKEGQGFSKGAFESDLQFNSKFQSGNLEAALRVSKREYWLFMREDTNTFGLRQWFFFQVISSRPINVTFRIYKFTKKYSLYRHEMRPYIKQDSFDWAQKGENVSYEYDSQMKCFYLRFGFQFKKEKERILVAGMPPYTYSRLTRYIGELEQMSQIQIKIIGKSLGGVDIPLIEISSMKGQKINSNSLKRAIIMIGRTHPAETCSNFSIESIISKILESLKLRQVFDFFIIPMVNPDGVIVGNHRTSLAGVDLNRKFTFNLKPSQKELYPEVEAVKSFVKQITKTHKIEFFMDLHGHSAKKNIFAYGEREEICSDHYLKCRIIPKLLAEHLSSFRYDHCLFQSYKQKKTTARVYFGKKYKFTTLTFEQSYGLLDYSLISIRDWKDFGSSLISVINEYMSSFMQKSTEMTQKLKTQIQKDQVNGQQQENIYELQNLADEMVTQVKKEEELSSKKESFPDKTKEVENKNIPDDASELESGDEQLQNTEQGLQKLRNKIFVARQQTQRQSMNLPDTSIELDQITRPRASIMHEQKMPIISRILRMREKRKKSGDLINILTQNTMKEELQSMRLKIRQHKIKLPNIQKYLS